MPVPSAPWLWTAAVIVAAQAVLALGLPHDHPALANLSDLLSFGLALVAVFGFLRGVLRATGKVRAFYLAFVLGSLFRAVNLGVWAYYEVFRHAAMDFFSWGNTVSFMQVLPLLVGLALRPHRPAREGSKPMSLIDVFIVCLWWTSIYTLAVLPWRMIVDRAQAYSGNYSLFYALQHLTLLLVFQYFSRRSISSWRFIYRHLFLADLLYFVSSSALTLALSAPPDSPFKYYSGSFYDLPLNVSFLYWAWIAIRSREWSHADPDTVPDDSRWRPTPWATVGSAIVVLSLPAYSLFVLFGPEVPASVRDFRLMVTAVASLLLTAALLTKLTWMHRDLFRALRRSETAYSHLHEVQGQLLNAEKLASLSRLVAGTMHEINNPLAAIHGYSDLLANDPRLDPATRDYAEKLRHNARRTKQIVQDLLAFGRPTAPGRNPLGLAPLLDRAIAARRLQMETAKITSSVAIPAGLPLISGDEVHLLQALVEIIDNAIQAMQGRPGMLHISATASGHQVAVCISDTGPGISQPDLVFDPFYTTRSESGAKGLGLSVAYGVIRDHGGRIRCFNRPEGGATFEILLPSAPAAAPVATATPV